MRLTKSHPVSRALRRGLSMRAAWAAFRRSKPRRVRRRRRRSRNFPAWGPKARSVGVKGYSRRKARKRHSKKRRNSPVTISTNPRKRRKHRKRRSHRRRRNNPLIRINRRRRKHRRARRRGRSRRRRNQGVLRLYNPGGIIKRAVASAKSIAKISTLKHVAGLTAGVVAAWVVPMRFLPQRDVGLQGLGISAGVAVAASLVVSLIAPAFAPLVLIGGLVGTALKAVMQYGRGYVGMPQAGMGEFLRLQGLGMGQIPASQIAGMGAFLETKSPIASIGPASAVAISGERFSAFS